MKALVSKHSVPGQGRGEALSKHVAYLSRPGAGLGGGPAGFFDRTHDGLECSAATLGWAADRHHFRFIVSPEHGDRIADLSVYTREVMRRVGEDLGQPELIWIAVCHFDTDQPHAHVLVRGRRSDGKDLVIPRDYIAYGFRARAQEVAHELLGDLSRVEAERRIWRETQANHFTRFDRRLLLAADADRVVQDGAGLNGAWAALTRGRLRHLEAIGLAHRDGGGYRLDAQLEEQLRTLQLRQDIIRTLQQRRLEVGPRVRELDSGRVHGRVVRSGVHDELGAVPWVIVRDAGGVEHYARLASGHGPVQVGKIAEFMGSDRGARVVAAARGNERGR